MDYVSVKEYAQVHGVAERTIRNYCLQGKLPGARLLGRTWSIPSDAALPSRGKVGIKASPLLTALREQRETKMKGGIYHRTQIDMTYNSNHIEGSRLNREQTRYIFETNTIVPSAGQKACYRISTREFVNVDACVPGNATFLWAGKMTGKMMGTGGV